jgi:hypothetical protein
MSTSKVVAIWIGRKAQEKGYSRVGFTIFGLFVTLIALIVVLVVQPTQAAQAVGMPKCPYCAETVQSEAKVCKRCGRDIQPVRMVDPPGTTPRWSPSGRYCNGTS